MAILLSLLRKPGETAAVAARLAEAGEVARSAATLPRPWRRCNSTLQLVHIPKAGGTTIKHWFEEKKERASRARLLGTHARSEKVAAQITRVHCKHRLGTRTHTGLHCPDQQLALEKVRQLTGATSFCVLRQPVSRAVSALNHCTSHLSALWRHRTCDCRRAQWCLATVLVADKTMLPYFHVFPSFRKTDIHCHPELHNGSFAYFTKPLKQFMTSCDGETLERWLDSHMHRCSFDNHDVPQLQFLRACTLRLCFERLHVDFDELVRAWWPTPGGPEGGTSLPKDTANAVWHNGTKVADEVTIGRQRFPFRRCSVEDLPERARARLLRYYADDVEAHRATCEPRALARQIAPFCAQ